MTQNSLEQKLHSYANPFDMLYNSPAGVFQFPLTPEFSNWRDEQKAWRDTAILQDMSFHMTDVEIEGPDAFKLVSDLGINSFKNFGPMQAKQFVACNYDGFVIGDGILICEEEQRINFLGRAGAGLWLAFHAQSGKYDVKVTRIEKPSPNPKERTYYRFQVQGPNADKILAETNGGPLPDIGFFQNG